MLNTRQGFTLLALATATALVAGCGAPAAPAAPATVPPPTATEEIPENAHPEIARVSMEEAKAAFDAGSAVFVDVRSIGAYRLGHIPGSINLFFGTVEQHMDELDKQEWIITYCDCPPHEQASAEAASILLENGFLKANPMSGGFEAWKAAGLPLEP